MADRIDDTEDALPVRRDGTHFVPPRFQEVGTAHQDVQGRWVLDQD